MKSAKAMCPPAVVVLVALSCFLVQETNAQNACETDCVRGIYATNCGQASCITGVSSSEEFDSLCGPACISAISGGGMLDCLTSIGGSTDVQNSFVLTVQNFCAQGDPFQPVSFAPAESPGTEEIDETVSSPTTTIVPPIVDTTQAEASAPPVTSTEITDLSQTETTTETENQAVSSPPAEPEVIETEETTETETETEPEPSPEPALEPEPEPESPPTPEPEAFFSAGAYDYDFLFDMDQEVVTLFDSNFEDNAASDDGASFL